MPQRRRAVRFANPTEERFADLLRSLRLTWEYEPHMFVLRTRPDGSPALAFTPDFYLPEQGMYLELTTLRQKLVTLKNRKARLLLEQRPDLRLRILYRRDCQELLQPVRSARGREGRLRSILPEPTEDAVRRARWLLRLPRVVSGAGDVAVRGVRLPLGPEWAGRRVLVWVYAGLLEIEHDGLLLARFPCAYDAGAREFRSVEPGEVLRSPEYAQGRLGLPELLRRPEPRCGAPGRRRRDDARYRQALLPL